jgi:ubiquinone/menaquinone biosynthesis C-methylase UbiE
MKDASQQWSDAFAGGTADAMGAYDRIVARTFTPWAEDLVDRLSPQPGSTVLDIACGPGTVTHILAERIGPSGKVFATDISPSMLAVARAKEAAGARIEWIESPAAPLPIPDDSVASITCQQGLQFFPDKTEAFREMRRVLADGGRALVSTWTVVQQQDFWNVLYESVGAAVTPELAARYTGPFSFTGEEGARLAEDAGFSDVRLEHVTLPSRLEGGAEALYESLVASGIAAEIAGLESERRAELFEEIVRRSKRLERDGDLHGTLTTSLLTLS